MNYPPIVYALIDALIAIDLVMLIGACYLAYLIVRYRRAFLAWLHWLQHYTG